MAIEKDFFVSVLEMVDDGLMCSLQTYDDDLNAIIDKIKGSKIYSWADTFILDSANKNILIEYATDNEDSIAQIYYFEIKKGDDIVFVAYDGFEIGMISSCMKLTEKFVKNFVETDLCGIVDTIVTAQSGI